MSTTRSGQGRRPRGTQEHSNVSSRTGVGARDPSKQEGDLSVKTRGHYKVRPHSRTLHLSCAGVKPPTVRPPPPFLWLQCSIPGPRARVVSVDTHVYIGSEKGSPTDVPHKHSDSGLNLRTKEVMFRSRVKGFYLKLFDGSEGVGKTKGVSYVSVPEAGSKVLSRTRMGGWRW